MQESGDIRERAFLFANAVLDIALSLPQAGVGSHIRDQISRSGTAIGVNIEEADGGTTKAEKRRSFITARKEAQETRYWLRIIAYRWPTAPGSEQALQEATEIKSILSAIIEKLS